MDGNRGDKYDTNSNGSNELDHHDHRSQETAENLKEKGHGYPLFTLWSVPEKL